MPPSETARISGHLTLELRDGAGALLERRSVPNLITDAGKVLLARLLGGKNQGAVTLAIAVGESQAAPVRGNTALGKQLVEVPAEMGDPGVFDVGVRVTVRATIPPGGDPQIVLPLTEAGVVVHVGDQELALFNRVTFPVINKGASMSLLLSWDLTF